MVAHPRRPDKPSTFHTSSPARHTRRGVPIYTGTRVIGHVVGDTFFKTAHASRHLLKRPRGWAADLATLDDARAAGATHIQIHDAESGAIYRTSIQTMLDAGLEIDRGYGRQIVLPLADWQRPDLHPDPEQLDLFGGAR